MRSDVKSWCGTCKVCQTRRNTGKKGMVPLKPMSIPSFPMEMTDVLGPLYTTIKGNKDIFVLYDYLARWPETYVTPDHKEETIAKIFVE